MKKFNPFNKRTVSVPRLKPKDLSREVLFTQDFGKVQLHFWDIVHPGEKFALRDNTKSLSTPFAGPQFSSIDMKTRYFVVPMRKAVPHYEEFILSDPSDMVTEFHTTLFDIFRAQMYHVNINSTDNALMRQALRPDGLAHYVGIPWIMDQLCLLIFGKDLMYMEAWTQVLFSKGGKLDSAGNDKTFYDYFAHMISVTNESYPFSSLTYSLVWTSGQYDGDHPTVYSPSPFSQATGLSRDVWCVNVPALYGGSMETLTDHIVDDVSDKSLQKCIDDLLADNSSTGSRCNTSSGSPSASDIENGYIVKLSGAHHDEDPSVYFFGQNIRLAPFCAYQKIRYDWFTDLRVNDDVYEEFFNYVTNNISHSHYVDFNDTFTYQSKITGNVVTRNILAFLFTNFVIDYKKDYFTTCAHQPQAGPDIVIGPSGKLDVMFDVETTGLSNVTAVVNPGDSSTVSSGDSGKVTVFKNTSPKATIGSVWAQINESDEITPLKLRWQEALQQFKERRNIGGYGRYTDLILGQYGIRVPDPYLLRSVYFGGYRTPLNTNPVVAQADGVSDDGSCTLGDIGAYASGRAHGPNLRGFVKEHVVLVGVNYVVPQNYYFQGLSNRLTDINLLDYPFWQFSKVGEQTVRNREIFLGAHPNDTFGYNQRYSDKFFAFDELHGEFVTNLRHWHTGRKFLSQPSLNQDLLSLRGQDGHNDILIVDPSVSMPFRCIKYINYVHYYCV